MPGSEALQGSTGYDKRHIRNVNDRMGLSKRSTIKQMITTILILHHLHQPIPFPSTSSPVLSLRLRRLKRRREPLHIIRDRTLIPQELDIRPIDLDLPFLPQLDIVIASERREPPVLADDDFLAAGEFVHGATEGLDGGGAVVVACAYGEQDLADVDAGHGPVGLAPRPAHSRLQSIGARAGQHFVDPDDVVRVGAHAQVEPFFAGDFHEVSVTHGQVSHLVESIGCWVERCPFV